MRVEKGKKIDIIQLLIYRFIFFPGIINELKKEVKQGEKKEEKKENN